MPDTLGLGAGIGGKERESAISNYVNTAETGAKAPQASDHSPPMLTADKQHPGLRESAAYKATPTERATHVYGAPIQAPVLNSGK